MIAEKAADMIRGRQLQPYEPDHGRTTDESRLKLHLREPFVSRPDHTSRYKRSTRKSEDRGNVNVTKVSIELDPHTHPHLDLMESRYGASMMAENIIHKFF